MRAGRAIAALSYHFSYIIPNLKTHCQSFIDYHHEWEDIANIGQAGIPHHLCIA